MAKKTHHITCPLCEATCGLEVTTDGPEVLRIRGDQDDVFSKGFICPKGSTLKHLYEDPDRLTRPMIKSEGRFVEATWDEAFAAIAERLGPIQATYGKNSVGMFLGNPNVHNLAGLLYLRPVIMAAGTQNLFSASTVDQMPKHVSSGLMWGNPNAFPIPDIDRSDYILILGGNPYVSNGSLATAPDFPGRLDALMERGGQMVVVDPRKSKTASKASEHVPIKPGGDVYLLLAMINTLVADGLVDIGRLEPHVTGLDWVIDAVKGFTPASVEGRTGIAAETITRLAREFAAAPSAVAYGRMGAHTVEFGTITSWATDVLNVITGNLDRPGGAMFCAPPWIRTPDRKPGGRGYKLGRWTSRAKGLPEVNGEFPSITLADEIETPGEGQIKAMIVIGGNPIRSYPNSKRLEAAFETLDFMISVDPYITETSQFADVILPPRAALERSHFDLAFLANAIRIVANYSEPVFETDQPDDCDIHARLALAVGGHGADADPGIIHEQLLGADLDRQLSQPDSPIFGRDRDQILELITEIKPAERLLDLQLRTGRFGEGFGSDPDGLSLAKLRANPHGIDFGPLVERMPSMIRTESGKVELAPEPIVTDFERLADSHSQTPDPDALVLVGRRHLRSNNSWMHNVRVLVKGKERCTLQVHPSDADRLGLVDGGSATVTSKVGSLKAPVEVTADVMAGVVSLPHGWGHNAPGARLAVAAEHAGVNSNDLTDDSVWCRVSGNAVLNAIPVEVVGVL